LERVRSGEEVTITRHGEPVAVIIRPDTLRARRADRAFAAAAAVRDVLDRSQRSPLRARPALSKARAEAMVADVRADRSSR
jgi:antitoxin (DNA-binding transcriptional repressor) of toxin-antitoxin stability system